MFHRTILLALQLAGRAVLPVAKLGLLGALAAVVIVGLASMETPDPPQWLVETTDSETKQEIVVRCTHERERLMKEMQKAATTRSPKDVAAVQAYVAIENEFVERARADRLEAYLWMIGQLEGKSLYDL